MVDSLHYSDAKFTDWTSLAQIDPGGRLFVTLVANPNHRRTCRIKSFTADELVCKGFTGTQTYKSEDIAALIVPGEHGLVIRLFLGLNAALGASIWGTVVLAATCPVCAVGTGVAALLFFADAGAVAISDDQPDRLLYLAPGQTLHIELPH